MNSPQVLRVLFINKMGQCFFCMGVRSVRRGLQDSLTQGTSKQSSEVILIVKSPFKTAGERLQRQSHDLPPPLCAHSHGLRQSWEAGRVRRGNRSQKLLGGQSRSYRWFKATV